MKRLLLVIACCVAGAVLVGCGGSDDATYNTDPGTTVIIGNVVSYETAAARVLAAVEGVTVFLLGTTHTTTTGSDGKFELTNVAPGSYKVVFQLGGIEAQYALTVDVDLLLELKDVSVDASGVATVGEVLSGPIATDIIEWTPQPELQPEALDLTGRWRRGDPSGNAGSSYSSWSLTDSGTSAISGSYVYSMDYHGSITATRDGNTLSVTEWDREPGERVFRTLTLTINSMHRLSGEDDLGRSVTITR